MTDSPAPATTVGILRLKLGASCSGPTKALYAQFDEAARLCNAARNAVMRSWLRWREDHTEFVPPPMTDKDGTPRTWMRRGRALPMPQNKPLPDDMPSSDPKTTERKPRARKSKTGIEKPARPAGIVAHTTWLYQQAVRAAPNIRAEIMSIVAGEIWSTLTTKMPYDHEGDAIWKWQAILTNEISAPTCRMPTIPAKKTGLCLTLFGGESEADASAGGLTSNLPKSKRKLAVLEFALWSKAAGRRHLACRIETRLLSEGNIDVLRHVLDGRYQMADSDFVRHSNGHWYLHLVYRKPVESLGLDPTRTARMAPAKAECDSPMEVVSPEGRVWRLGQGRLHQREYLRLESKRIALNERRTILPGSGRKGHGRQRQFRDVKQISRRLASLTRRLQQSVADELLRFCVRHNCGAVEYCDPTQPVRNCSWAAKRELQWDWTRLLGMVRQKCRKAGIQLDERTLAMAEWKGESRSDGQNTGNRSQAASSAGE